MLSRNSTFKGCLISLRGLVEIILLTRSLLSISMLNEAISKPRCRTWLVCLRPNKNACLYKICKLSSLPTGLDPAETIKQPAKRWTDLQLPALTIERLNCKTISTSFEIHTNPFKEIERHQIIWIDWFHQRDLSASLHLPSAPTVSSLDTHRYVHRPNHE